jgi:sigma-54 specific flagellar transcriptional regulator A
VTREPAADAVILGPNARMRAVFDYIERVGPGRGTVLVTGESGTGKEVVARAVHRASARRDKPFVAVSCALFADTLIEAELFGHERGAFTGAIGARAGRFELAEGGTLFLDDIDDVPLPMQVKLLRALQNRTIERLGSSRSIPVDVRVVAGTKRDLRQMVAGGRFREDLYYRLHVLAVDLPPLRERRDDLPLLIDHFLRRFFARRGVPPAPIGAAVMDMLLAHDWPGNVRELENTCERIAESCTCGRVRLGCLGASILFPDTAATPIAAPVVGSVASVAAAAADPPAAVPPAAALAPPAAPPLGPARGAGATILDGGCLDEHLRRIEARLIAEALAASGGNKSRAARLLGVKRSTLGDRIARCGAGADPVRDAGVRL